MPPPFPTIQRWGLLEANEQKRRIQHCTGGVGPYVNIPMQSVPTVLTMIVGLLCLYSMQLLNIFQYCVISIANWL